MKISLVKKSNTGADVIPVEASNPMFVEQV